MFSSYKRAASSKHPIHILLRYSDRLNVVSETIPEHQKVILKHGAVWFGKLGRPVSITHVERINGQIADGIPTFLYLVQRVGNKYETFLGTIVKITKSCPGERELIPDYYFFKDIVNQISMWVRISNLEPAEKGTLGNLVVATSGMPVLESLPSSMAAHFIVQESPAYRVLSS